MGLASSTPAMRLRRERRLTLAARLCSGTASTLAVRQRPRTLAAPTPQRIAPARTMSHALTGRLMKQGMGSRRRLLGKGDCDMPTRHVRTVLASLRQGVHTGKMKCVQIPLGERTYAPATRLPGETLRRARRPAAAGRAPYAAAVRARHQRTYSATPVPTSRMGAVKPAARSAVVSAWVKLW